MHSFHEVHEGNASWGVYIRQPFSLSVCPQIDNYWMDKNEIWCWCCAKGHCLQIVLLTVLRSVVTKIADNETCEVGPRGDAVWKRLQDQRTQPRRTVLGSSPHKGIFCCKESKHDRRVPVGMVYVARKLRAKKD